MQKLVKNSSNIFLLVAIILSYGNASNKDGNPCPYSQYQDHRNICIVCPPGRMGINCAKRCPIGYYGNLCKSRCSCAIELCSFQFGCLRDNVTEEIYARNTENVTEQIYAQNTENVEETYDDVSEQIHAQNTKNVSVQIHTQKENVEETYDEDVVTRKLKLISGYTSATFWLQITVIVIVFVSFGICFRYQRIVKQIKNKNTSEDQGVRRENPGNVDATGYELPRMRESQIYCSI